MNGTRVTLIASKIILVAVLLVAVKAEKALTNEVIYIRADGRVDPIGSPVSSSDNITYVIGDDLVQGIVVERDDILLWGANRSITGTGSGTGIGLFNRRNITIQNVRILDFSVGILVLNSTAVTLVSITLSNNYFGTTIWNSSHGARLMDSTIFGSHNGVWIRESENTEILSNALHSNLWDAIFISRSANCIIERNVVYLSGHNGIRLDTSSSAILTGNSVHSNLYYGAWVNNSDNCTVTRNLLSGNSFGLRLDYSSDSNIYQNSFLNNSMQVFSLESRGTWDNGFEGNYFSDYSGVDNNRDGVGDSPQIIYSNNVDRYPLMGIFSTFPALPLHSINVVSNSSIEECEYSELTDTIRMRVSATPDQNHGFCRITIPHILMDVDNITVVINGGTTEVLHLNTSLHDNGVNRWIYFSYRHSTLEIVILPEFSGLTMLMVGLSILLALLALKREKRAHKDFIR